MRISFTRSGGLVAAPGLRVRAVAMLDESGGEVVADPDYRRAINPDESAALASDVQAVAAAGGGLGLHPSASATRDAFQFQFTIETTSGTVADVKTTDPDARLALPEFARLVRWASIEADAIIRWRATPKS